MAGVAQFSVPLLAEVGVGRELGPGALSAAGFAAPRCAGARSGVMAYACLRGANADRYRPAGGEER